MRWKLLELEMGFRQAGERGSLGRMLAKSEDRNISQKLFCCLLFWWLIFSLVWYRRHPVVPVPSRDGR